MNSEPKLYEISYVLKLDTEEALAEILNDIKKYIEEKSGRSLDESRMMKKRLAYPIGKNHEGFFGNMKFFLKPEDMAELESKLGHETRFIRCMITAVGAYGTDSKAHAKKVRRVQEKKATDVTEIDKKLEEILGE